ncbi:hypothetical protein [Fictibacillus fluitans]|uniref:Uncharacterized protein n=1 Tax=Fictibacillus fluitans TaxID=3058422 RepID=A0ABT8HX46_9BACL|nr:hypothetical protein [Fictibacillus sp. NE201]MDN4525356.1 hypothetical protein [Fictibacillus sp. NE201]
MSVQISKHHLAFVEAAREAFEQNPVLETFQHPDYSYIALRMGEDRDCIEILEVHDCIANFVQQMDPAPGPRYEVRVFAQMMENQLRANDHKTGWKKEKVEFLCQELSRNYTALAIAIKEGDRTEVVNRCANIANFSMMIGDNEGTKL